MQSTPRRSSLILNTLVDSTATPDDILAVLRDEHRHQCEYDPEADPDANLTFDSSIEDWRIACDLVKWQQLALALNLQWGLTIPIAQWQDVLTPPKSRKLHGVCKLLAATTRLKSVISPQIFGRPCTTAGVFFAIRELLERDGADVSRLTPSSLISEYSIEQSRVFEQDVSQLAPGVLPSIKILNPDYERATGFLTLAIFCFFCSLLMAIWIPYLWIPFGILVLLSIPWTNHVARHSKPTEVSFGELKTFRDICRTLTPQVRT